MRIKFLLVVAMTCALLAAAERSAADPSSCGAFNGVHGELAHSPGTIREAVKTTKNELGTTYGRLNSAAHSSHTC